MTAICLASLGLTVSLLTQHFSLSWQHSIEKTQWREFWEVKDDALLLYRAEIKGSGAGMEPLAGGHWEKGFWVYQPRLKPLRELVLTHSPFNTTNPEYQLCIENHLCQSLAQWLPSLPEITNVTITPCSASVDATTSY